MKKNSGLVGMNFEQIMIQQAKQVSESPVYCRICGIDVKKPSKNSASGAQGNWSKNLDWEVQNEAHVTCAQKHWYQKR